MSFTITTYGPGTPFYTGDYALAPELAFTVGLDGRDYPVDLRRYRYNGLPRFREGVVTSGEPNDQLFDSQGAWWRYRYTFEHGAGQEVADLGDDRDPKMYWESRGIDPWDENQACLLPATTRVRTVAASTIRMVATGQHLYVSDGTSVYRSADLSTWDTVTGLTGTINDMTTDGVNAYIATTTFVYQVAPASLAAATFSTAAPTVAYNSVAVVGNRLIASDGNRIGELKPASFDVFYTHFQPAFRWNTIFQVGARIYVGGFAGNKSELFGVTTTTTGALALAAEASSFFSGELLRTALAYGGAVVIGTSKGVRFATLAQDATLQYGPLIDVGGECRAIAAEGRFAWYGVADFPGAGCGLGRLALDTFTQTLLPAYAFDVFTEAVSAQIEAVARFAGRTVFAVSGDGVYASSLTAYVTEGTLNSGDIYFGTIEDKSMTELQLRFDALAAGEGVEATVTDEGGTELGDGSTTTGTLLRVDLSGEESNRARVQITLTGPGTSTPCLRQWRLRSYPVAPAVDEWLVPLIIQSRVAVNDGEGQQLSFDPFREVLWIRQLRESAKPILYREGAYAYRVRVDNFEITAVDWRDGFDWLEVTCTVRLLSA